MAAKKDPEMDKRAQTWIEEVIDEKFPQNVKYEDALKNGVILCKLMNAVNPGSIKKINVKGSAFAMRENIESFQKAARQYGIPDGELFQTIDLYEKRNMAQVTLCIFALSRLASKNGFTGPKLCAKYSKPNSENFIDEKSKTSKGACLR